MAEILRLDKLLSSQFKNISRNDVKKLCQKNKITVNGKAVKRSDVKVSTDDNIIVDGKELTYKKHIYIMLNKPKDVVCSTKDGSCKTVLELVPQELARDGLFPAGRLDKDTEGFVLITDDGEFAHRILSPKSHVEKEYFVKLERPWEKYYEEEFSKGMTVDGGEKCLPAVFKGDENDPLGCRVILKEGKYHQVKRMFAKLGNKVEYLRRDRIGSLYLDQNLPLGECLEILHKDVENL